MSYIAHKDGEREQSVLEHLTGTAKLSASFADAFGASEEGFRCGLLHDVGKYSEAFQRRIRGNAEKTDHATAGALEAAKLKDTAGAFCIAGHHGGLPNLGNRKADKAGDSTLHGKLKRKPDEDIGDYSAFALELPELPAAADPQALTEGALDRYFYIKMLYSCLVDADYLDTEVFMSGGSVSRGGYDSTVTTNDLEVFVRALAKGESAEWDGLPVKPDNHFYVLGLAPNAARLSVRFFLQDSFGGMVKHLKEHDNRLRIVTDNRSKWKTLPLWALLSETVNKNARDKSPSPQMAGDTLRAILTGGLYPATLYQQTQLRIRAEREVTRGRAAIIKAYLMRNTNNEQYREALTVELNDKTNYQPYVLGRMFSVLEAIQQKANPGVNTTIKDKYFSSACATPAVVFPTLLNLAEKHLRKMDTGSNVYYSKQLGALTSMLTESYPAHQTLADQGIFQLGYYHKTQKRYEKKNTEKTEEVKENV